MVSFNFEYVTSSARLPAIAQEVASASVLAEDFETTGFSPILDEPRLWSINTGKGVYVIDLFKTGRPDPIIQAHKDNPKAVVVGQNLKFDQKFALYHYDLEFPNVFDCFRASSIMWTGRMQMGHNLWDLYRRELKISQETEDLGGSDWKAAELTQAQREYAAEDVVHLPRLREVMKPKLAQANLNKIALIEFQAILAEAAVELNGFYLNPKSWRELYNSNKIKHDTLQNVLWEKLPDPSNQMTLPGFKAKWNLDSTQQMLKALLRIGVKQRIRDQDSRKMLTVDLMDTNQITLAMLTDQWPVINDILDYRETATQLKMFGMEHLEWVNPITHRVHPEYWPFLISGRYGCSKPNLAQIPRDKRFRNCFQAEEGYVLVLADYSNIEMRIVAEISGDDVLIKVFCDGEDAHYYTAGIITGKAKKDITKPERQQAKPVNFGFIYGMQPAKLVLYAKANYGVNMTEKEATVFRNRYFERFKGLKRWHDLAQRDGQRDHMAWSIWGRLRFLDGEFFNEYYNHPVQATGADGLKRGLRMVYERLKKITGRGPYRSKACPNPDIMMVHHVHDEIICEVKEDPALVEAVKRELPAGMKEGVQPMLPRVPVEVEPSVGKTWAEK